MIGGRRDAILGAMRLATIRTEYGTTAARLDGDVLVPLDAADVGEVLAVGGETRPRAGAVPVPAVAADFAPVVPRPAEVLPGAGARTRGPFGRK